MLSSAGKEGIKARQRLSSFFIEGSTNKSTIFDDGCDGPIISVVGQQLFSRAARLLQRDASIYPTESLVARLSVGF